MPRHQLKRAQKTPGGWINYYQVPATCHCFLFVAREPSEKHKPTYTYLNLRMAYTNVGVDRRRQSTGMLTGFNGTCVYRAHTHALHVHT